ncbi:MAG: pyruvate kinase [Deltaproteobacteria bacterium]|uniref:Pyruvate kinase n=1 Tax=Candidatus Zymogenus saltonus TaxID=2844893 RepID=A0A9D8PPW4_9DELT|nr:pyruvate kinase [Candidatus Zymogenus saltonus]
MRPTKIICTLGPATESIDMIRALTEAGMDAVRLNFSHGTHEGHKKAVEAVRKVEEEIGRPIGIIADLAGPKIRVKDIPGGTLQLNEGETIRLTGSATKDPGFLAINYPHLAREAKPGERVFISDGTIELKITKIDGDEITAIVKNGGEIMPGKGVNLPDTSLSIDSITEKDREDIAFCLGLGIDWAALSFVRSADDIVKIKEIIVKAGKDIPVIAKIEKTEALTNIASILEVSDGILVARGDLGVETPLEQVPLVQKILIRLANEVGKPVIVATHMLESMIHEKRPTRAEASDVANAVIDGSDALLLSGETAMGKYPIEAAATMAKIANTAKDGLHSEDWESAVEKYREESVTHAVCHAAYHTAKDLNAAVIVTPTSTGTTPRMVARYKPKQPIVALSPKIDTIRRLTISFNIFPRLVKFNDNMDDLIKTAKEEAVKSGFVESGDIAVITAGFPPGVAGTTNLIRVEVI